jgi:hypothetical protein
MRDNSWAIPHFASESGTPGVRSARNSAGANRTCNFWLSARTFEDYGRIMKGLSEITKEALDLPPAQRLVLARILLDASEDPQDFSPEAESAWDEEITRRMEMVRQGKAQSRSFEEVFRDLESRFPG